MNCAGRRKKCWLPCGDLADGAEKYLRKAAATIRISPIFTKTTTYGSSFYFFIRLQVVYFALRELATFWAGHSCRFRRSAGLPFLTYFFR